MEKRSNKKILITIGICALLLVWAFAALFASQYIVHYPLYWIFGEKWYNSSIGSFVCLVLSDILAVVLTILVPHLVHKKLKTDRDELGLSGLPTWTDIGLAPIGYIVATLAALGLVSLFSLFPWFNATETQNIGATFISTGWDRALAFIKLVIVAPIAEELIFRGWLYGKLRAKVAMPIAILLVSVLFALVHGQWNVGRNDLAMSIVLCGLREVTGTVYAGIIMHMIKNAIALVLLMFMI